MIRVSSPTKTNEGTKITTVARNAPIGPATEVPEERGRGEQRPGGELPDRDRVEQLLLG